ncbi:MAG TPA: hypothetical protein VJQ44_17665 [Gemmatimonadales bacterium]|nr:hypothetical protein [Gemmatimonadales bacterium]
MSTPVRRIAALLVLAAALALLVALSRAPWPRRSDHALLRLSWSGRPERIERCRELSDAELEELPAHMRLREECEGHSARYRVRVWVGDSLLSQDTVTGGGLRGDRAIYMLREYRVTPGRYTVGVEVARTDRVAEEPSEAEAEPESDDTASVPLDRARRERQEHLRERLERLPPSLRLDTTLRVARGDVVVVSYDPIRRRLVAMSGSEVGER